MLWKKRVEEKALPTIVEVGAFDGDFFDVTLSNGNSILFGLADRAGEPAFAAPIQNHTFCKPKTDGRRVYWTDGPSLSLEEIIEIAMR